jgi:hypothetical protein
LKDLFKKTTVSARNDRAGVKIGNGRKASDAVETSTKGDGRMNMTDIFVAALAFVVTSAFARDAMASENFAPVIKSTHKYIFLGEIHGTVETPALFFGLVESVGKSKGKVAVGLEIPPAEQSAINAYVRASDAEADQLKRVMLAGKFWNPPSHIYDGRSSNAMLDLLGSVRRLVVNEGVDVRIICFAQLRDEDRASYVKAEMLALPHHRFVGLSGNIHTMHQSILGDGHPTMVSLLTRDETFSIDVRANSGSAWICRSGGVCGPQTLAANPAMVTCTGPCFVDLAGDKQFDAAIILQSTRASPPATLTEKKNVPNGDGDIPVLR